MKWFLSQQLRHTGLAATERKIAVLKVPKGPRRNADNGRRCQSEAVNDEALTQSLLYKRTSNRYRGNYFLCLICLHNRNN